MKKDQYFRQNDNNYREGLKVHSLQTKHISTVPKVV